jgi:hypothetical protein
VGVCFLFLKMLFIAPLAHRKRGIMQESEIQVKEALRTILDDRKSYATSLNYAVNYCSAGLALSGHKLKAQCLYILNNITHWRNPKAKLVRQILKEFSKGV